MKRVKYLLFSMLLFFPMCINALGASVTISCDKSLLSINEITNCTINANVKSGALKGFDGISTITSNLEITKITISDEWVNNSNDNNISVSTETAKTGKVTIGTVTVKATSVVPETTEKLMLSNISLVDENDTAIESYDVSKEFRIPSNNASLSSLAVSSGTLSPTFDPNITEYAVSDVIDPSVTITASGNSNASISGTGLKDLVYGNNSFNIVVKAEAGNTKTYKININRIDTRSSDSSIKILKVNGNAIDLTNNVKNYRIELESNVSTFAISVETNSSKSKVSYSSNNVSLDYDETYTIYTYVTAENGSQSTYSVTATRKDNRSSNNNLKSLSLNNQNVNLTNLQSYTMTVNNDITTANVNAIAADEKSKVEITGNKNLKVGSNVYNIKVTAENGSIKTYKLTVIRKNDSGDITNLSNNTFLKKIEIANYNIDFNKDTLEYELEVENNIKKLDVKYEVEDKKASATIDGNDSELKEGENKISILVTAENGETSTYVIKVNRKQKNYEVENDVSKIIEAINNKNDYEQVIVNTNGDTNIQNRIIKALISSKKTITYNFMEDTLMKYSVSLNGATFNDYSNDFDFKIDFTYSDDNLNALIDNRNNVILDFIYDGNIPTGTIYKIYVGNKFNNNTLYMYYYNDDKELELVNTLTVENNYITVPMDHLSTYVLFDSKLEELVKDANNEPSTTDSSINMMYIYIGGGIVLLTIVVVVIILISKNKNKNKKQEQDVPKVNNISNVDTPIIDNNDDIDIIDMDDLSGTLVNTNFSNINSESFVNGNAEYLFGISVMDVDDYLEKAPLSGIKNDNIKEGIVIVSIDKVSPLVNGGINQGDVLLEFNNEKIINKETFKNITFGIKHGDKCTLKYYHNGKESVVEVNI